MFKLKTEYTEVVVFANSKELLLWQREQAFKSATAVDCDDDRHKMHIQYIASAATSVSWSFEASPIWLRLCWPLLLKAKSTVKRGTIWGVILLISMINSNIVSFNATIKRDHSLRRRYSVSGSVEIIITTVRNICPNKCSNPLFKSEVL